MYFSRIHIRPGSFDPEELLPLICGEGYADHALLWKLFPDDPDAKRDFLYRREEKEGWPFFYLVSQRKPQDASGLFLPESKEYRPRVRKGEAMAFSLRVNPVITRKDDKGKRKRHDVVMNAKKPLKEAKEEFSTPEIVQESGISWLAARAEKCGFSFDPAQVRTESYLQHNIKKPGQRKNIRFSTLDFQGLLMVKDEELFISALYKGIGPAKSFGCGLLLVKRI